MATQHVEVESSPRSVIERLQATQNQQDLEAFLGCIDPDYQSEQVGAGIDAQMQNWAHGTRS